MIGVLVSTLPTPVAKATCSALLPCETLEMVKEERLAVQMLVWAACDGSRVRFPWGRVRRCVCSLFFVFLRVGVRVCVCMCECACVWKHAFGSCMRPIALRLRFGSPHDQGPKPPSLKPALFHARKGLFSDSMRVWNPTSSAPGVSVRQL